MITINSPPKEGDIYKTIRIDEYVFELKYGYYEDFERDMGEPVVIYPDLSDPLYAKEGFMIVTAVQESCEFYEVSFDKTKDGYCVDCIHYSAPDDDIGICKCNKKRKTPH